MFNYSIPSFLPYLLSGYTWKVKTKDKLLFLTFDDGPHPQITPWVLEQLRNYNAKATFFCVGENIQKYPEVAQQILSEQHAIGNHTYNHLKGWSTPNAAYFENVKKAAAVIPGKLFRPPYGRISFSQARMLRKNYRIVMWNKLSRDYLPNLSVQESLHHMRNVKPGDILVFHDSEKSWQNLQILLPELLAFYHSKGFRFEPIPEN